MIFLFFSNKKSSQNAMLQKIKEKEYYFPRLPRLKEGGVLSVARLSYR
jgi:hypothetical protein